MDIDINRLRHVLAVARTRNFTRAAEELNITQPALSRSIASFEAHYGVKLFDRSRSGVEPTATGRQIIVEAEELIRSARGLDHNLRLYARGETGELAIGLGPLVASWLLPSIGKFMLETRPALVLRNSIRTPDHLLQELLEDRIEFILGNSSSIRETVGLTSMSLGTIGIGVFVRDGHPLTGKQRLMLADLAGFPVASASELDASGLPCNGGAFVCDNYHILRDLVPQTDCLWLCTSAFVADEIVAGKLRMLDVDDLPLIDSDISLVHRSSRTLSPAANAVIDHVGTMISGIAV